MKYILILLLLNRTARLTVFPRVLDHLSILVNLDDKVCVTMKIDP